MFSLRVFRKTLNFKGLVPYFIVGIPEFSPMGLTLIVVVKTEHERRLYTRVLESLFRSAGRFYGKNDQDSEKLIEKFKACYGSKDFNLSLQENNGRLKTIFIETYIENFLSESEKTLFKLPQTRDKSVQLSNNIEKVKRKVNSALRYRQDKITRLAWPSPVGIVIAGNWLNRKLCKRDV